MRNKLTPLSVEEFLKSGYVRKEREGGVPVEFFCRLYLAICKIEKRPALSSERLLKEIEALDGVRMDEDGVVYGVDLDKSGVNVACMIRKCYGSRMTRQLGFL